MLLSFALRPSLLLRVSSKLCPISKMYYSEYQQAHTHLISTGKLSEMITGKAPGLAIVDASMPMPGEVRDCFAEFKQQHIPGAQFLSPKDCEEKNTDNINMLPNVETFKECMEKLGIRNSSKVVVYDANEKKGMFSSPKVWYMMRVFGHREVYVLDGGLKKWKADGNPVESGEATAVERSSYTGIDFNPALVKSLEEVKANITDKKFQLIDARSPGRFNGTAPEPRPDIKPGHIPDSKCMFWTQFLDDGVYKTPEKLREVYESVGVDPMSPHVATCGTGVTACFIALSSYILGNYHVPVYDGAWADWYQHAPEELKEAVPKE